MKLPKWLKWVLVLPMYVVLIVLLNMAIKFTAKISAGIIGDGFFIDLIASAYMLYLVSIIMYRFIPSWKMGVSLILLGLFTVMSIISVIVVVNNTDGWEMWKHIILTIVTIVTGLVGIGMADSGQDIFD